MPRLRFNFKNSHYLNLGNYEEYLKRIPQDKVYAEELQIGDCIMLIYKVVNFDLIGKILINNDKL